MVVVKNKILNKTMRTKIEKIQELKLKVCIN